MNEDHAKRLSDSMGRMIMMMQTVDDTCVELTKDIEKRDLMLISYVGDNEKPIMREIAEYLDIPVSTATGIIEKLVKKGYLKRYFSPEDRRSIRLKLARKGQEAYELLNKMRVSMTSKILSDLTHDEAENFIGLMEKITTNLNKYVEVA